jgi:hypothetical protein
MGHYPFTLFNAVTLLILALTLLLAWRRLRGSTRANWPLLYYAAVVGYAIGFSGGLNRYWVAVSVACGVAVRCGFYASRMRFAELIPLTYIAWRSLGLLLMW